MAFRIHFVFVLLLSLYSVHGFILPEWLQALSPDLGFSWGNCGLNTDPIQLKTLSVTPDPIKIPGNETVSFAVAISSALPTDIHASLNLEKKVGSFYIKVPCEHDVGSCTYSNFCAKWGDICQKYFEKYGFPCQCPIPAGNYSVPDSIVDFTKKLSSQADGEFKLTVNIGGGSGQLGCFNFHFKLKS